MLRDCIGQKYGINRYEKEPLSHMKIELESEVLYLKRLFFVDFCGIFGKLCKVKVSSVVILRENYSLMLW